ncbi:MAG: UDP-2,3-diacylglucosamine diphosphatase [Epsilonproteobacteria bacterium]|nr:UDP-2,3-diacylglucosamine diphosphatase [Campylobacterota bacterium]
MTLEVREGAIFIADAHHPNHGDNLLRLLNLIDIGSIDTTQLFLVGDIFDLLFGYNNYIKSFSQDAIHLINRLSKKVDIFYIEGNHDFCLDNIFPDVRVYGRDIQPVKFSLNGRELYISHGDRYCVSTLYNLYSSTLRSRLFLTLFKFIDRSIIDYQMDRLKGKSICFEFKNFHKRIDRVLQNYPDDALIIEGHYHQKMVYKNYISIPSLACSGSFGVIKGGRVIFVEISKFIYNRG